MKGIHDTDNKRSSTKIPVSKQIWTLSTDRYKVLVWTEGFTRKTKKKIRKN